MAAAESDQSDMDTMSDVHSGEESEYEEIEEEIWVEEEIEEEVEEEIEEEEAEENEVEEQEEKEEEEDEDKELGESSTPIDQTNHRKDSDPISVEENVNPASATLGNSVANLPLNSGGVEDNFDICRISASSETKHNEASQVNGKVTPIYNGISVENANLCFGAVNAATSDFGGSSKNTDDNPFVEKRTCQRAGEGLRQRSSTPESGFSDSSKRQALMCDFFAKGWCIRGSTCRFLHVKDQVGITSHASGEISDTAQKKTEHLIEEVTSSIQLAPLCGENCREKSGMEDLPLLRRDLLELSSQDFKRDLSMDNNHSSTSPLAKGGSCQGILSNSYSRLSKNFESTRNPAPITGMEEMTHKNSNFLPADPHLPVSVSSLQRSPLSFSNPSGSINPSDSPKLSDNGPECRASRSGSMQQSSSPHYGSESENLSRANALGDKKGSVGLCTNVPYDWAPSAPFQPSYPLTRSLLSRLSSYVEYRPTRDSIVDNNLGKESVALGTQKQGKSDAFDTGIVGTECSSNKYSISEGNFHGVCSAKNIPGKDICREDDIKSLGARWQDKKTLLKEKKLLLSDHIRDVSGEKISINCDTKLESGDQRRSQSKEESSRSLMEADADLKVEEARAWKNFRASLVEVVKEQLRPSWHGGLLNKDAYKIIVKKSVEKVLSTLPPHQIPSTSESVKLYLSSSKEKLAKLVGGYVDKYRKS